jgi:peptidyl-prolyl cis-trans isomerase D
VRNFGLTRGEIADFRRGEGGAPLGSDAELNAEVFAERVARQGAIGGPLALGDDRLVVFQVLEHRPAKLKPLDEVRPQVIARLTRERGTEQARKAAEESLQKLNAGEDLAKVAAALKLAPEPTQFHGRGAPELPVEIREATFKAPRPDAGKPIRQVVALEAGAALMEVTASRVPSGDEAALLRDQLVQREMQRRGGAVIDAYMAELLRNAKVEKNLQVLQ